MGEIPYERLVEQLAEAFHETYELLAPTFGWQTQEVTRLPWAQVPERNRELMRATVGHLLQDGVIEVGPATVEKVTDG